MPETRTPDKFARSYVRENSWQSYQGQPLTKVVAKCMEGIEIQTGIKRFFFGQMWQNGTVIYQGCPTEMPLATCKGCSRQKSQ